MDCKALYRFCSVFAEGKSLILEASNPASRNKKGIQGMGLDLGNGDVYWQHNKTLLTEKRELIVGNSGETQ